MSEKELRLKQELLLDIKEKLEKAYEIDKDYEINSCKNSIERKLIQVEYKIKYDIELKDYEIRRTDWICIDRFKGNIYIGKGMEVLNSKEQPKEDEILIQFAYPTGAYIFGGGGWFSDGSNYDRELFDDFFEELKTYNYKYIDELNSCLYFDMENGIKLFKKYNEICKKYQNMWDERKKVRKIKALKEELKILGDKGNE